MAKKKYHRNIDGIYLNIQREKKLEPVCLSDMTREELETNLSSKSKEWLKDAVIHLALLVQELGEYYDIGIEED